MIEQERKSAFLTPTVMQQSGRFEDKTGGRAIPTIPGVASRIKVPDRKDAHKEPQIEADK